MVPVYFRFGLVLVYTLPLDLSPWGEYLSLFSFLLSPFSYTSDRVWRFSGFFPGGKTSVFRTNTRVSIL